MAIISDELWAEMQAGICIGNNGAICIEPRAQKLWKEAGEDFDILCDVIEGYICEDEEDGELFETIDWPAVEKDYIISMKWKTQNASEMEDSTVRE
jgi:hypothetical protein